MTDSEDREHCGVGIRGVAMFIDSFVWFALLFVAIFPIAAVTGDISSTAGSTNADLTGAPAAVAFTVWLALGVGYHAVLELRYGKTVGKHLVKIRAERADGRPLTPRDAVVRNALRVVDWLPMCYGLGILAVASSDEKQRVGDRTADTVVVRD